MVFLVGSFLLDSEKKPGCDKKDNGGPPGRRGAFSFLSLPTLKAIVSKLAPGQGNLFLHLACLTV